MAGRGISSIGRSSEAEIEGVLSEIRFQKDDFMIGRLEDGTAIKGLMPMPQTGLRHHFRGRWVRGPRWGDTFHFSGYKRSYPTTVEAIRVYLERNAKWVGPEVSKRIVGAFGVESLSVLKTDPERVAREIDGITPARAAEISAMLRAMEDHEKLELALNDVLGEALSPRQRSTVVELWSTRAPEIIRENPYALIEEIDGVGFSVADRIAARLKFARDGYPRVKAGLLHVLRESAWSGGHTLLPQEALIRKSIELLGIEPKTIADLLARMISEAIVVSVQDGIYLQELYRDETSVAQTLKRLGG